MALIQKLGEFSAIIHVRNAFLFRNTVSPKDDV
jgi:hypothetical protein